MHQHHHPRSAAVEIGLRLKTRRLEVGLTPAQFAERLGVAAERIQELESGMAALKVPELARLCSALQVRPMWIFEGLSLALP